MESNQFNKTSEESISQNKNKNVSETKNLKKLKKYTKRKELIGVDIEKAGISLTADVMEFCRNQKHEVIGIAIYFNGGVV